MEFAEQPINGVFLISLNPKSDDRGFFMRSYDVELFKEKSVHFDWVQENHSLSLLKGTLRGLHFQLPPYTESKLIRCIRGAMFDVFVDLREGSPHFGKWGSVELRENDYRLLFLPKGFAHGFCTLTDHCEVVYKVDNKYSAEHDCGIRWNDNDLNIQWPVTSPILSKKDAEAITFREFVKKYKALTI